MGKFSRDKGKRYERELAGKLRDLGFNDVHRTAQFRGNTGAAGDLEGIPGIHIEAKEHGISYRQMVNDLFYNGRSRPGGDYPIADDVERAVMDIAGGDYDRSIIPQIAEKIKMDGRYQNIVQEYVENELQ